MAAEVCTLIHWCRTQSSFHSLKEHTGSSLLSSQGWIHGVSVLLCSPAYDLFICGVEHSDKPPHPHHHHHPTPPHHTLHPQPPNLSDQKNRRMCMTTQCKINPALHSSPHFNQMYSYMDFTLHVCVCAMTETGQIREGERTHDALSTWYAL